MAAIFVLAAHRNLAQFLSKFNCALLLFSIQYWWPLAGKTQKAGYLVLNCPNPQHVIFLRGEFSTGTC